MTRRPRSLPLFPEQGTPHPAPLRTERVHLQGVEPVPRRALPAGSLWLAVYLPDLPLQALVAEPVQAAVRRQDGPPCAVVESRRIIACDAAAAAAGVLPGLAVGSALALCPVLELRARQPVRERRWLNGLAGRLAEFSPLVSLVEPDGLVCEVGASLKLFGGSEALHARCMARLEAAGVVYRLACAPTPLAATWLARAGGGEVLQADELAARLSPLSLSVCRWPEPVAALLRELGLSRLGECLRLPRDGLARRAGPELLEWLDRALGRRPDPRRAWRAARGFHERLELPAETESLEQLVETADLLLTRLAQLLRQRDAAVQRLRLELAHLARPPTRIPLELSQPTRDVVHLQSLCAQRLERISLPAPVVALGLSAARLETGLAVVTARLFEAPAGTATCAGVPQLVERLRARLGVSAVHGLCLVPEHRPEAAWQPVERPDEGARAMSPPALGDRRPLWMLAEPVALQCRDGQPRHRGPLVLAQGPERIETGWWDGRDVARDYYVAHTRSGVRLWIYRERQGARRWWLHGVFG